MDMGHRIEQAKRKAEAAYQKKKETSSVSAISVSDCLTDDELNSILSNDFFSGNVAELSVTQRYEKIKNAALWLDANSMEVVSTEIEPLSSTRRNVTISIEIRRMASLRGKELRVFSAMSILSDNVFFSGVRDSGIIFSFGIENI